LAAGFDRLDPLGSLQLSSDPSTGLMGGPGREGEKEERRKRGNKGSERGGKGGKTGISLTL